jgi:hypothetical protein
MRGGGEVPGGKACGARARARIWSARAHPKEAAGLTRGWVVAAKHLQGGTLAERHLAGGCALRGKRSVGGQSLPP